MDEHVSEPPPDIMDASGHDQHGHIRNPEYVTKGEPPIMDEGFSYRVRSPGYLDLGALPNFDRYIHEGITVGADLQVETHDEVAILGTDRRSGSAVEVTYNTGGQSRLLQISVRDRNGASLTAHSELSPAAAKRLLLSITARTNTIVIREINPIRTAINRHIEYRDAGSPSAFSGSGSALFVAAHNEAGEPRGRFLGRVAHMYVLAEALTEDRAANLAEVSWRGVEERYGQLQAVAVDRERRALFRDDLEKLRGWMQEEAFGESAMRDASVILYRWLFDRNPVLLHIAQELGILLSLPGESERARRFHSAVEAAGPIYAQSVLIGRRSLLGFHWVPPSAFASGSAFVMDRHPVSHEALLKFVRNKLGGGHFDPVDRKKWQRELAALEAYVGGVPALRHQMHQIVLSTVDAVDANGIEALLGVGE